MDRQRAAERISVCLLSPSFPRYAGDFYAHFAYEFARELVLRGLEVHVVASHAPGTPRHEDRAGIHIHRYQYAVPAGLEVLTYHGGIPAKLRSSWLARAELPGFLAAFLLQSVRAARQCTVLHAYWLWSLVVGLPLALLWHKPVVLTVQGSDVNLLLRKRLARRLARVLLSRVGAVIAVSQALKDGVCSLGAPVERVTVIPNGVDPASFPVPSALPRRGRLIWVGRMAPEKGLPDLLEAMPQVLAACPDASLTLIGDGPLRQQLESQARALGITARVSFAGAKPHSEIGQSLNQSDVFVLPSYQEGHPVAALEAMLMGRPLIATAVGGLHDLVVTDPAAATGLLVPVGTPGALANAIISLLGHPELADAMGRHGRQRVLEHYTWTAIGAQTVGIYERVWMHPV